MDAEAFSSVHDLVHHAILSQPNSWYVPAYTPPRTAAAYVPVEVGGRRRSKRPGSSPTPMCETLPWKRPVLRSL
jgi:hypothetical protein